MKTRSISKIKNIVKNVITYIQTSRQLNCPALVDSLIPIDKIQSFDSPTQILATSLIVKELRKIYTTVSLESNIFIGSSGALTLGKIYYNIQLNVK